MPKTQLVEQPTARPTNKVTATAAVGAVLTIVLGVAEQFYGLSFDAGVQGAMHTVLAFVVGYFLVRDRTNS